MESMDTPANIGRPRGVRRALEDTLSNSQHGSEEQSPSGTFPLSLTPNEPSSRPGNTDANLTSSRGNTDTSWEHSPPKQWTHTALISFLEHMSAPRQALELAIQYKFNGATFLATVMDTEAHQTLQDEYGFTFRATRLHIITMVKDMQAAQEQHSSAATDGARVATLVGEKQLKIPDLPKAAPGQTLCTAASWKYFITGLTAWAELGSESYATVIHHIHQDPDRDLDKVHAALNSVECRLDAVLGAHLWQSTTEEVKRMFARPANYEIAGKISGIKMVCFMEKKINSKCTTRYLTLNTNFTSRQPVTLLKDLFTEINAIISLSDDLCHQGQPPSDITLFTVLHRACSGLIQIPELHLALALPIKNCTKQHGLSGEKLLETLKEIKFEIHNDPALQPLLKLKTTNGLTPPTGTAAGAIKKGLKKEDLPARHNTQKEGALCLNERELGKCGIANNLCKAKHQIPGFTHTECSNPIYKEMGLSPNFHPKEGGNLCMCKHGPVGSREEYAKKPLAAKQKYPKEFEHLTVRGSPSGGVEPMTCGLCDLDPSNMLPEGSTRTTREPNWLIQEVLQNDPIAEDSQERLEYQEADSNSDPELETCNSDLLDMGTEDCAGNRYNFTNVMLRSRVGMSEGLPRKHANASNEFFDNAASS